MSFHFFHIFHCFFSFSLLSFFTFLSLIFYLFHCSLTPVILTLLHHTCLSFFISLNVLSFLSHFSWLFYLFTAIIFHCSFTDVLPLLLPSHLFHSYSLSSHLPSFFKLLFNALFTSFILPLPYDNPLPLPLPSHYLVHKYLHRTPQAVRMLTIASITAAERLDGKKLGGIWLRVWLQITSTHGVKLLLRLHSPLIKPSASQSCLVMEEEIL